MAFVSDELSSLLVAALELSAVGPAPVQGLGLALRTGAAG